MEIKRIEYDVLVNGINFQFETDHLLEPSEFDNKIYALFGGSKKFYVEDITVYIYYKNREIENDWGD